VEQRSCRGCRVEFVPTDKRQVFHSRKCKERATARHRSDCPRCGQTRSTSHMARHLALCAGPRLCDNCGIERLGLTNQSGLCAVCGHSSTVSCPKCEESFSGYYLDRHVAKCDGSRGTCGDPDCTKTPRVDNRSGFCKDHRIDMFRSSRERRVRIAERDGMHQCVVCGRREATEDHCLPQSLMNAVDPAREWDWLYGMWNLELLCRSCNSSKNDRVWPEQRDRAFARFEAERGPVPESLRAALDGAALWSPAIVAA
jgi:hypothetical protein